VALGHDRTRNELLPYILGKPQSLRKIKEDIMSIMAFEACKI
jgi:hypothetical protein